MLKAKKRSRYLGRFLGKDAASVDRDANGTFMPERRAG
jgi:hypothetical protein